MLSADDPSIRPLSAKLLERPTLLTRIRWAIPDHEDAYLVPYVCTELEYELGRELGIPVQGADPKLAYLGTKSGGRELFARAGVAHPTRVRARPQQGRRRRRDRASAAVRPRIAQVVVKLDAGVSGEGNAIVELRGSRAPGPGRSWPASASAWRRCASRPPASLHATTSSGWSAAAGSSRSGSSGASCAARASSSSSHPARRGSSPPTTRSSPTTCASAAASRPTRAYAGAITEAAERDRRPAGRGGRDRTRRDRLHRRPQPLRQLERVRDRDQPAQGRHDAPAGRAGARSAAAAMTPSSATFRAACGSTAPLRRHRPPRVSAADGARRRRRCSRSRTSRGSTLDGCGVVFHMFSALTESGAWG